MNFLKKGPELKLSEIKVPDFVLDVYYDLKDRHLLPVAAILLAAIVAVPIALSQSSNSGESGSSEATLGAAQSSGGASSGELVAKSAPGLRDYRRRLARRRARNPFKQQFGGEESNSSEGAGTGESAGSTSTSSSEGSAATTETPSRSETGSETEGQHLVPGKLRYYSYAIDVRVSAGGSQADGSSSPDNKATVRRNLPELTMLPSRETPAIIYMGSTKDGKKALMVVSSNVDAIFGDAKCVLGSETCEMLAMEPELPETFVYGGTGRTYKIELLKIHLVETNKLNRAPLGKPKKGKSSKGNG